jgi:hypothetical protein
MESTYDVVWPKSARGVSTKRAATRLDSLNGKRIGFVWDYMFRGEEIFPVIERGLRQRYEGIEVIGYDAFGNIHGPDEHVVVDALPGALAQHGVDGVIVGNGC